MVIKKTTTSPHQEPLPYEIQADSIVGLWWNLFKKIISARISCRKSLLHIWIQLQRSRLKSNINAECIRIIPQYEFDIMKLTEFILKHCNKIESPWLRRKCKALLSSICERTCQRLHRMGDMAKRPHRKNIKRSCGGKSG